MTPAQDATALADKEIGKQLGEYLGMSDIDAEDVAYIRNLVSTPSASAGPQAEAVAWTNEAQLAFLRQRDCADIPMAMWAKESSSSPIPLYAHPQPQQADGRGAVIEECAKLAECWQGSERGKACGENPRPFPSARNGRGGSDAATVGRLR